MNINTINPKKKVALVHLSLALFVLGFATIGAQAGQHSKQDARAHGGMAMKASAMTAPSDAPSDIVSVAVAAGQFKTLAAALTAADLVGTLQSDGPFTVFAPTDAAFAKLPAGTVESLLLPENKDKLVAILTYHVVPGRVASTDVVKLTEASTANGRKLNIKVMDGKVKVNNSTVTAVDVEASNGVIHIIDTVILP